METRQVTQVKIFKLILNDMTDRAESCQFKAFAYDREKLIAWYKDQLAPNIWQDDRFSKSFKKDSPLEWNNPLSNFDVNYWGQGIHEEWANQESVKYFIQHNQHVSLIE